LFHVAVIVTGHVHRDRREIDGNDGHRVGFDFVADGIFAKRRCAGDGAPAEQPGNHKFLHEAVGSGCRRTKTSAIEIRIAAMNNPWTASDCTVGYTPRNGIVGQPCKGMRCRAWPACSSTTALPAKTNAM